MTTKRLPSSLSLLACLATSVSLVSCNDVAPDGETSGTSTTAGQPGGGESSSPAEDLSRRSRPQASFPACDDSIDCCPAGFERVGGTSGDDDLDGVFTVPSCLAGFAGDDRLDGSNADNVLLGGPGVDDIDGGFGADIVLGGDGADDIRTIHDADEIDGGPGDDEIDSGFDDDTVFGGEGNDDIDGGDGADWISAGPGDDIVEGGFDADYIEGNAGDDEIEGGIGDDTIIPGPGRDEVDGGIGDDTVIIYDVCELEAGEVLDGGFAGNDTLIIPFELTLVQGMGVTVEDFENIIVQSAPGSSECADGDSDDLDEEPHMPPAGGGAGDPDSEEEMTREEFLDFVSQQEPLPDRWEFVGYVNQLTEAEYDATIAARQAAIDSLTDSEHEALLAAEDQDPDASLLVAVSADGRIYRERPGTIPLPITDGSKFPDFVPPEGNRRAIDDLILDEGDTSGDTTPALELGIKNRPKGPSRAMKGSSDGRRLKTSEKYPWRAVGVALWSTPDPPADEIEPECSAAMIGTRKALTAAHCISPGGYGTWRDRWAVPAARGRDYDGDQSPRGVMAVEWAVMPFKWEGQGGAHYDYAVLILSNRRSYPGYVLAWSRSTVLRKAPNTAGYPNANRNCYDAPPESDPDCGGYQYRQHGPVVVAAGVRWMEHWLDMQNGQSGAPLYKYDPGSAFGGHGNRRIFGIHTHDRADTFNYAHRINSGSIGAICKVLNGEFQVELPDGTIDDGSHPIYHAQESSCD